jgi:hypothetical protein
MQAKLEDLMQTTEIRDTGGRLIGYFTPASARDAELYARARQHFGREEIQRRKSEPHESYTTAEVLDHVRSLGSD